MDDEIQRMVETAVVNHLGPDHFWRGKYEVDIILDRDGSFPVEVKYRSRPDNLKGLEVFIKKSGFSAYGTFT